MKKIAIFTIVGLILALTSIGIIHMYYYNNKDKNFEVNVSATAGGNVLVVYDNANEQVFSAMAETYVIQSNTKVTFTAEPSDLYNFIGWEIDGVDKGTDINYQLTISANTSVLAKFESKTITYTITDSLDNEFSDELDHVLSTNLLSHLESAYTAPQHYTYLYKYNDAVIDANTIIPASATIVRHKIPITYTISFNINGETVGTDTYTIEDKTVTEPIIAGYNVAWDSYDLNVLGNKTVNGIKTLVTYTVTFKVDGATVGTDTYTIEDKTVTEPTIAGYNVVWNSYNLNVLGNKIVNGVKTAIKYTVTFKVDGETVGTDTYTIENKTVTEPTIAGYNVAWDSYDLNVLGNKTVNGVKTAITYTLTFKNGDEVIGTRTYTVENKTVTAPDAPASTDSGYINIWEDYDLSVLENKTINVVKANMVKIDEYELDITLNITDFAYSYSNLKIAYYVDSQKVYVLRFNNTINSSLSLEQFAKNILSLKVTGVELTITDGGNVIGSYTEYSEAMKNSLAELLVAGATLTFSYMEV